MCEVYYPRKLCFIIHTPCHLINKEILEDYVHEAFSHSYPDTRNMKETAKQAVDKYIQEQVVPRLPTVEFFDSVKEMNQSLIHNDSGGYSYAFVLEV